jgi:hypothetical protein
MNKKTGILILVAVILGTLYVFLFTDWLKPKTIQIMYRNPGGRRGAPQEPSFFIDPPVKLSSIQVFDDADFATNKYPHPIWSMVAVSNSALIDAFLYGGTVKGMKPAIAQTQAEPLDPDKTYRLVVRGEKIVGEKKFQHQIARK